MKKIALITGASSGIGRATAKEFAKNGYDLIITGRRKDRLRSVQKKLIDKYANRVHSLVFDVRDAAAVEKALNNLDDSLKSIDVLINNAGLAKGFGPVQTGNLEDWDTMIDTNIKGLLYVTRIISNWMAQRKEGHIINIGSTAGQEVYSGGNVYCATKYAVRALTKAIRLDLYDKNIRISQISPGAVEETEFAMVRFDGDKKKASIYNDYNPLKSKDVARVVYFVASQPKHVNIQDILFMGTQQASATLFDKSGRRFDK